MAGSLNLALLTLALTLATNVANADVVRDPTQPPVGMVSTGPAYLPDGGELQAVLISPTRRAAIINGQTIQLGGRYRDERLVGVSEGRAVLQGEHGRRELRVFSNPGVQQNAAVPAKQHLRIKPARVAADKGKQ
jgi:MSHA biogenesis protein MshK